MTTDLEAVKRIAEQATALAEQARQQAERALAERDEARAELERLRRAGREARTALHAVDMDNRANATLETLVLVRSAREALAAALAEGGDGRE